MAYIKLSDDVQATTKIMIFLEGTILKPKSMFTFFNHHSYVPIGDCVSLIETWATQGAEIVYCTSRKRKQAEEMAEILRGYAFCGTRLYFREKGQTYKNIVETVRPNILIEDDCKSIGGSWQMCITYVAPEMKQAIQSIVVKEFKGIDHLPEDICLLRH